MRRRLLPIGLLILLVMIFSCGVTEFDHQTGSIVIVFEEKGSSGEVDKPMETLSSVQCVVLQGSTIRGDENLTLQGTDFYGEISGLPAGSGYSVIVYGKNSSGTVIARAEQSGLSVTAGRSTTASMSWSAFTPVLSSPSHGSTINDNTPSFDWNDVIGASEYRIEVDNSPTFVTEEILEWGLTFSGYTATIPLDDGMYYWRVRARDSRGVSGAWSSASTFSIR